jgi:hypothetical protein
MPRSPAVAAPPTFGEASSWSDRQGPLSFIDQMVASSISERRPAPQEIGERPFPLNDAGAGTSPLKTNSCT